MSRDRLAASAVATALDLHKRRLWLELGADQAVLVEVPAHDRPVLAFIMGQGGESYGVVVHLGEHAFDAFLRTFDGEGDRELTEALDYLGVSIEPFREIPPDLRRPLQDAGFVARRDVLAPMFVVKQPNRHPRSPNRTEMKTMLWVMKAILTTHAAGTLRPPSVWDGKIMIIRAAGELRAPEFTTRIANTPKTGGLRSAGEQVTFPQTLKDLPLLDTTWIVGLPPLPIMLEGDDRTFRGCLVVDADDGFVLKLDPIAGADVTDVARVLTELFLDDTVGPGLPGRIGFVSDLLFDLLEPALERLGIETFWEPNDPHYSGALRDLEEHLRPGRRGRGRQARNPRREVVPDTLEGLKKADLQVTEWMVSEIVSKDLMTSRARTRYFGVHVDDTNELLGESDGLQILPAFFEWLLLDYRPTRTSRTHVEKMLQRKLTKLQRVALEARLRADLSFWRVESSEPGETLQVQCVLSGRWLTLHDRALSSCALEGSVIPLRVVRAGRYFFPVIAGPRLPSFDADGALRFLEQLGLELTPTGLRQRPELVGRLWSWVRHANTHRVVTNTDDEPLRVLTAFFHVSDPNALATALRARSDVAEDEHGAGWRWFKKRSVVAGFGETTTLGHLERMEDALTLSVNSAERLARARSWLERIPGVTFTSKRERTDAHDGPLDDLLPPAARPPPSRELFAEVERRFHEACMAWLDASIPVLGGKTPRQMCKTTSGRRQIARMIRTYPQPLGVGGIRVPRQEMFRALGLEATEGA